MANDLANEILKKHREDDYWFNVFQQDSQTMQKTIDKALEGSIVLEEPWSWKLGSGLSLDEWIYKMEKAQSCLLRVVIGCLEKLQERDGVDRSESIERCKMEYDCLECYY